MNVIKYDGGWINLDSGIVFYFTGQWVQISHLSAPEEIYVTASGSESTTLLRILETATEHTVNQYG